VPNTIKVGSLLFKAYEDVQGAAKSIPYDFFAVFAAVAWNFKAKFLPTYLRGILFAAPF